MKYDNQNFIGVFDSGIGGISVLNELIAHMPNENYIYFADTANFPYGKKSKAELFDIGKGIISQFNANNAKALVIACNTMSTCDTDGFKSTFPNLEIIGTFPSFTHIFKPGLVLSDQSITYDKENGINISRNKFRQRYVFRGSGSILNSALKNIGNFVSNRSLKQISRFVK